MDARLDVIFGEVVKVVGDDLGERFPEIISDYFHDLTEDDIKACVHFAKRLVENDLRCGGERR